MEVTVPQICWHDDTARIMSCDFYPNSNYFVTASQYSEFDSGIRFWKFKKSQPNKSNPPNASITDEKMAGKEAEETYHKWEPIH